MHKQRHYRPQYLRSDFRRLIVCFVCGVAAIIFRVGLSPAIVDSSGVRRSKRVTVNIDELKTMAMDMSENKREDPAPSAQMCVCLSVRVHVSGSPSLCLMERN